MNENDISVNVENEDVKSPVYNSSFLMSKEVFYDFCSVLYHTQDKNF